MKANMLTSQLDALKKPAESGEGVVEIRLEGDVVRAAGGGDARGDAE
jgi:gluconate kinase